MQPTKFAPPSKSATRPQGVPAIVRSGSSQAAETTHVHAAEPTRVPSPKQRRMNELEDYVAKLRKSVSESTNIGDLAALSQGSETNSIQQEIASATGSNGVTFRTDAAHATDDDSLAQFAPPHIDAEVLAKAAADDAYKAQLVSEISTAIASALTDVPVEVLEDKLRRDADHSSTETRLVMETQEESTSTDPIETPDEAPATSGNEDTLFREISASVAAWDVQDFRWPALSNQMIATASDAMQNLFDSVEQTAHDARTQRVAVTGTGRGEGSSTIAISLARWAVASGKSVLLIDADLASPGLTNQVGLEHGLSWLTALGREDSPAEVIIRAQSSNLCLMPLAPIADRSGHSRCIYDSLGPFLGKIEQHFDLIILDVGPGSQLLAELSRPELLIDSALLVNSNQDATGLKTLHDRLQAMGLKRFVLAQNSVSRQAAA